MSWFTPPAPVRIPRGAEHATAVQEQAIAIAVVFEPPYADLAKLAFDEHPPGTCLTCDAYRYLAARCD